MYICTEEDGFLEEKSIWFVDLSNGQRVWMDDNRPGITPTSAWIRLQEYLQQEKLKIKRLYLKFRSHVEQPVPEDAEGYFFAHKAIALLGSSGIISSMLVGYLVGDNVYISEWQTPEIIETNREVRTVEKIISENPKCLIFNSGYGDRLTENS